MKLPVPLNPNSAVATAPSIVHEARSSRDYVELCFPFMARIDGVDCEGLKISRNSIVVKIENSPQPLAEMPVILRLRLSGFALELEFSAVCSSIEGDVARFRINRIDPSNQAVLVRLVRMLMVGIVPNVDDIALPEDDETPLIHPAMENGARLPLATVAFLCLAILLTGAFFGMQVIYGRLMTVKSDQAVLVAQQIDVTSTVRGEVAQVAVGPDGRVGRDDRVAVLANADIEADVNASEARFAYFSARLSDIKSERVHDDFMDNSVWDVGTDERNLRRERDYAAALLQSARLRATALSIYAPCDCVVLWSVETGAQVAAGERLMTLMRPEDKLTVEVKVPVDEAFKLEPGLRATFAYPGKVEEFDAILTEVKLIAPEAQGTYRSSGRFATLILTPDVPPDPSRLGQAVRAVIYR
jgi:mannuronan synthase